MIPKQSSQAGQGRGHEFCDPSHGPLACRIQLFLSRKKKNLSIELGYLLLSVFLEAESFLKCSFPPQLLLLDILLLEPFPPRSVVSMYCPW